MKKTNSTLRLLFLAALLFFFFPSYAQINIGGVPPSFKYEGKNINVQHELNLPIDFDVDELRAQDVILEAAGHLPRVGKIIPVI